MTNKKSSLWLFKKLFVVLINLILISYPVQANDIKEAEVYVKNLSERIISIVDNDLDLKQKQLDLLSLFNQNASTITIARAALGRTWKTLDKSTKEEFTNSFTQYLVQKYGRQFEEFNGAKLIIERSIDAGKRGVLVHTRLLMPATSPISVKWQVWQKTEDFKLIDIIIEDISMLTMEREEIKNRLELHNGNINSLIENLRKN